MAEQAQVALGKVAVTSHGFVHNTRLSLDGKDLAIRSAEIRVDPNDGVVHVLADLDEISLAINGADLHVVVGQRDIADVIREGIEADLACKHGDSSGHSPGCCAACRARHIVWRLVHARSELGR